MPGLASFVPRQANRELCAPRLGEDHHHRERSREIERLENREKLLDDACIKLSTVATDTTGISGRLMLQALIEGQDSSAALAELARARMRSKIPNLTDRFS